MTLTHSPASVTHHPDVFTDSKTGREYTVTQDHEAEDPRLGIPDQYVALWAYGEPAHRSSVATERTDNAVIDAFAHFYDRFDAIMSRDATRRWLRIFHDDTTTQIEIQTIRGYSQSDWLDVVCVVSDPGYGTPELAIAEFRQWAFGDVYVVETEDDRVGGIYADDAEEAVKYYRRDYESVEDQLPRDAAADFGRLTLRLLHTMPWDADLFETLSQYLHNQYGIDIPDRESE